MTCLIQDTIASLGADGNLALLAREPIHAQPSIVPFYRKISGVAFETQGSDVYALSNDQGIWSLTLPWPSESKPAGVTWAITLPDGTVYSGTVPEGVAGPLSIDNLVSSYGWTLAAGGGSTPVSGIAGPVANWRGAWVSTNNYAIGDAVSYNGSSYFCVAANSNKQPDINGAYWGLMALAGATGPTGPTGPQGPQGAIGPQGAAGVSGNYFLIANHAVVGANAAAITFSAIPNTYTHLRLLYQARIDAAVAEAYIRLQLNGDTGNNYDDDQALIGSAASSETAVASAICGIVTGASAPAGAPGAGTIDIPNYLSNTFEPHFTARAHRRNGSSAIGTEVLGGNWRTAAPITQIKLFPAAGNFLIGSVFSLYGIQ